MYETVDVLNARYQLKLFIRGYRQHKRTIWQITHSSDDPAVCYERLMQYLAKHEAEFNIPDEEV